MKEERSLCITCAWRKDCKKKYSYTGGDCLDYTKDLTLDSDDEVENEKGNKKRA